MEETGSVLRSDAISCLVYPRCVEPLQHNGEGFGYAICLVYLKLVGRTYAPSPAGPPSGSHTGFLFWPVVARRTSGTAGEGVVALGGAFDEILRRLTLRSKREVVSRPYYLS
jgi:hypothetical protein